MIWKLPENYLKEKMCKLCKKCVFLFINYIINKNRTKQIMSLPDDIFGDENKSIEETLNRLPHLQNDEFELGPEEILDELENLNFQEIEKDLYKKSMEDVNRRFRLNLKKKSPKNMNGILNITYKIFQKIGLAEKGNGDNEFDEYFESVITTDSIDYALSEVPIETLILQTHKNQDYIGYEIQNKRLDEQIDSLHEQMKRICENGTLEDKKKILQEYKNILEYQTQFLKMKQ